MNTIYFGGSFNPIHIGHLLMARFAAEKVKANKVVLIPAREPYHKSVSMLSYDYRLMLTRLATDGEPLFSVSNVERDMQGDSYAIDVLERLGVVSEGLYLVGSDNAPKIPQWHRFNELKKRVKFILVSRPGNTVPDNLPYEHEILEMPPVAISSTDIRDRVAKGLSISWLVPDKVASSIDLFNFYK